MSGIKPAEIQQYKFGPLQFPEERKPEIVGVKGQPFGNSVYQQGCVAPPVSTAAVKKLNVEFAAFGVRVEPDLPYSDPLIVRMSNVLPGAILEVRNRSRGFGSDAPPEWMTVSLGDFTKTLGSMTKSVQLEFLDDALARLGIRANDQIEVRQKTADGRTAEPVLLPLSSQPSGVTLPERPASMPSVSIGREQVAGGDWQGLEDTTNPKVDPKHLKAQVLCGELEVRVDKGNSEFGRFCEPRARVQLLNLTTGAKSEPVVAADDGTFVAQIPGAETDAFAVAVVDQSGDFKSPGDVVLVPLMGASRSGRVEPSPVGAVLATPFALDLDGVRATGDSIELCHAVPQGAVVTLTDSEIGTRVTVVADEEGALRLPAEVRQNRVYQLTVESAHAFGLDDAAADALNPRLRTAIQFTVGRNFDVQVDPAAVRGLAFKGGARCAVGADQQGRVDHLEGFVMTRAYQSSERPSGSMSPRHILRMEFTLESRLEIFSKYDPLFLATTKASVDGNHLEVRLDPKSRMSDVGTELGIRSGAWLPSGVERLPNARQQTSLALPINFPSRNLGDVTPMQVDLIGPDGKIAQQVALVPQWDSSGFQGWALQGS